MAKGNSTHSRVWKRLVPLLLIFLVGSSLAYDRSLATTRLTLADLPELSLQGVNRLLVVAPHPDDETLGAGGLIQKAIEAGIQVQVVVVTNGDGQEIAPPVLGLDVIPQTVDFIKIGERRQEESLAAMQKLGLPAAAAHFLSYPDRGTKPMWLANWNKDCPYYSPYTKTSRSPYPNTYDGNASYCGKDLLKDLQAILAAFDPQLVVLPLPDDQHPDHLSVSNFTRLAIALQGESNPTFKPTLLGYLVHYGYFPEPRGHHPDQPLLPPAPLTAAGYEWVRLDLTPAQARLKGSAIADYSSQLHLMEDYLVSFDRPNELFMRLNIPSVSPLAHTSLPAPLLSGGGMGFSEPSRETSRLLLLPGADLVGWQVTRLANTLLVTAETGGALVEGVQYRMLFKTPEGNTFSFDLQDAHVRRSFHSFTTQINLAELGNPTVLAFAAETRRNVSLDHTGWEVILLSGSVPATPAAP